VASPDGREGSVTIHADASIYGGLFDAGEKLERALDPKRKTYVHVVRGDVNVNGQALHGGDALRLEHEAALSISGGADAEVLVFDLH
jgi:quercetin 2,3-dioxygenase